MWKRLDTPGLRAALTVFGALSLLGHHGWGTADAIQRLALTRSLFLHGTVVTPEFGAVKYGLVQPVAMAPFYLAGHAVGLLAGGDPARVGYRFTAFFFTPLVVSALAGLFLAASLRAGVRGRTAAAATWALVFGTLLMPYSRILFTEPLQALLLFLGVADLFLADEGHRLRGFASLGLLFLNNALYGPVLLAAVAVSSATALRRSGRRLALRTFAAGSAVFLAASAIWALYDVARFGSPFRSGYAGETFSTPIGTGLAGLLVSPGRGLLWFAPLSAVTLALLALRRPETGPAAARALRFSLPALAAAAAAYACWGSFEGGWCWGPRFLLPFLPLVHLAFAPLLDDSRRTLWARTVLLAGCALGVLGAAWEYAIDWQRWEKQVFGDGAVDYLRSVWEVGYVSALHGWAGADSIVRLAQFAAVAAASWFVLARAAEGAEPDVS